MDKILNFLSVKPVFNYFFRVFKKDTKGEYPTSENLKIMHGINRISIVMFVICVIVLIIRAFTR